jgi:hypothetical protein
MQNAKRKMRNTVAFCGLLTALLGVSPRSNAAEATSSLHDADFAQHIEQLKKRIPADGGFTVVVKRPFVVIGDEPAATVESRAQKTVQWTVDQVKKLYFEKDPDQIIDIWLFRDPVSYDKHARELFGDAPTTRFGYYAPRHKALIMDISTGSGTLVHEIVHPFIATNFPACPAWFNEGLASLYEMCGEENGVIKGYPNWRLPNLQRTIKAGALPTFETLCNTTRDEFYGDSRGTYYSQARYLCYYLQQRGLLVKYYRQFRTNAASDPSGYKTLQTVLGESDMAAFQKRWEAFVLGLKFE